MPVWYSSLCTETDRQTVSSSNTQTDTRQWPDTAFDISAPVCIVEGQIAHVQHDEAEPGRRAEGNRQRDAGDLHGPLNSLHTRALRLAHGHKERVAAVVKELAQRRRRLGAPRLLAIDVVWPSEQGGEAPHSAPHPASGTQRCRGPTRQIPTRAPCSPRSTGSSTAAVRRAHAARAHGDGGVVGEDEEEASERDHVGRHPQRHKLHLWQR